MFVRCFRKSHNRNTPLTSDNKDTMSCMFAPEFIINSVVLTLVRGEGQLQWKGLGW